MKNLEPKIRQLKSEGKTYNEIREILGCSKGTIAYHLNPVTKEKTYQRTVKFRKTNPLLDKILDFTHKKPKSQKPVKNRQRKIVAILKEKISKFNPLNKETRN